MPWPAGSGSDVAMRGFLSYVERRLQTRIFTENIAGGNTARGMLRIKSARPDGYSIGTMTYDVLTIEAFDLVPVSWRDVDILGTITEHPSVLISRADRWGSLDEFIHDAVHGSARLKLGNVGTGGVFHQHAAAMEQALSADFNHVPYTSTSAQLSALLGREVDAVVASVPVVLPYVDEGLLRVLAVMAAERHPMLPEAPTFLEAGYEVAFGSFRMVVVPKGTADDVRATLEAAIASAWRDPAFQAWAARAGLGATWKGPEESRAYLQELSPKAMRLVDAMRTPR